MSSKFDDTLATLEQLAPPNNKSHADSKNTGSPLSTAPASPFHRLSPEQEQRLRAALKKLVQPDRTGFSRSAMTTQDKSLKKKCGIRVRRARPYGAPELAAATNTTTNDPPKKELNRASKCYVCKQSYRLLHPFYDQLCPPCASLNMMKRTQSFPLPSKVALVTGARLKIGFQIALKLLRAEATVIVTTRFPHDAALRYSREPDFASFSHRLHIFGADFRVRSQIHSLAETILARFSRLDIVIHNAAQTIHRPPQFYAHLLDTERKPLAKQLTHTLLFSATHHRSLPTSSTVTEHSHDHPTARFNSDHHDSTVPDNDATVSAAHRYPQFLSPALCSQIATVPSDLDASQSVYFPEGEVDGDGQQVDTRPTVSWDHPLSQVHVNEMAETATVNYIAPVFLTQLLRPLLAATARLQSPQRAYVVNVSSMEGKFARFFKSAAHAHTNGPKAALNAFTRSSGEDYAREHIFMTAVDTGWVTQEHGATMRETMADFEPPIDDVDGAARVLDPVFMGESEHAFAAGVFLKDYAQSQW